MESLNDYVNWEQEVKILLSKMLGEGESLKTQPIISLGIGKLYRGDFIFEKGCKRLNNLPENTIVEIKYTLSLYRLYKIKNDIEKIDLGNSGYKLLIIAKNILREIRPEDHNWCILMDENDLKKKEKEMHNSNEMSIKTSNNEVEEKNAKEQDSYYNIDRAKTIFSCGNNTLFIGAGLSKSAQLPDWNELLETLLKQSDKNLPFVYINNANANSISEYLAHSNIVTGRYVIEGYHQKDNENDLDETKTEVMNRIAKVLYKNVHESELVASVANMVVKKKIKQIITYNYDDLIEKQIRKQNNEGDTFNSISNNNGSRLNTKIPIYHVHGKIGNEKSDRDWPILSEKDYHRLYSNMHNWANVVQLNALYTTTCFFIGFSMTDPNQRRLLDLAWNSETNNTEVDNTKIPHFVFLKKNILKGEASNKVNEEHWKHIELMMNELGLNVIWFKNFEQLPKILEYISDENSKEKPNFN